MKTPLKHHLAMTAPAVWLVCTALSATAVEWGTIKGRLVLDGTAPAPAAITVNKDPEFCGQHNLIDETIVPGENGGLPNAFVFLYTKRGQKLEIHPDLAEAAAVVVLDNKGCRFEPHALVVRTGQPFEVHNSDPGIGHNTNVATLSNPSFNETVPNDAPLKKSFANPEAYPVTVACNMHPWMKAHLLIRDNPYMAVTAPDGTFEIANVPAGTHEFIFWHESAGNLKNVKLGAAGKTDRKGRAKLKLAAGETLDLGDVIIPAAALGL